MGAAGGRLHINVLETRAVAKVLLEFSLPPEVTAVVSWDNSTIVFYINREEGDTLPVLWKERELLFQLVINLRISLWAVRIPGKINVIADLLSCQDKTLPTEWSLNQEIRRRQESPSMGPLPGSHGLTSAPFEPLQLVASKFLAWKVFFLTLLPSGARRGKLHAITTMGVQHDNNWKSISFPNPGFILEGTRSPQKLVIPAFLPGLGSDMLLDHSLCLVQALKVYLVKSEDKCKNKELLFISYKDGHKVDLYKNTRGRSGS